MSYPPSGSNGSSNPNNPNQFPPPYTDQTLTPPQQSPSFPPQGYPQPSYSQGQMPYAPMPAPPQTGKKKRVGLIIGIIVLAVALITGGGVATFLLLRQPGGAPTAEASLNNLKIAVENQQMRGILTQLSPAEVNLIEDLRKTNNDAQSAKARKLQDEMLTSLEAAMQSFDISFEDIDYDTVELNESMTAFNVTGGTIGWKITDKEKLLDSANRALTTYADYINSYIDTVPEDVRPYGWNKIKNRDIEQAIDDLREDIGVQDHDETDIEDFISYNSDAAFSLVSVREGNRWYISPLLSVINTQFVADGEEITSVNLPRPVGYGSPEQAGIGFVQALASLDQDEVIASLPEVESRALALLFSSERIDFQPMVGDMDMTAEAGEIRFRTLPGPGKSTLLVPEKLEFSVDYSRQDFWDDYEYTDVSLSFTLSSEKLSVKSEEDGTTSGCKFDMKPLLQDEFPFFAVAAVKGPAGWQVSTMATLSNWSVLFYDQDNVRALHDWIESNEEACE